MKHFCFLMVIGLVSAIWADSAIVSGVTWYYTESDNQITIEPNPNKYSGELVIPSQINSKPVVALATDAFGGCSSLTSIVIPESIKSLGEAVFCGCSKLKEVKLPTLTDTAIRRSCFQESGITNMVIPEGITRIDLDAFHKCSSMKSITFPSTLKSIGRSAFYQCTGLTTLEFPEGFESFDYYSEYESNWQFAFCSNLQRITFNGDIPDNIATSALLKYGKIYYTVKYEGTWSGYLGRPPMSYDYKETIEGVEWYANDAGNGNVKINVGDVDYSGNLNIPTEICGHPVVGILTGVFKGNNSITSITIPDVIESLPTDVFRSCENIKTIQLPKTLTTIPAGAFCSCKSLTSVFIGDKVTNICSDAFAECPLLTQVDMPHSVKSIEKSVFRSSGIKSVDLSNLEMATFPDSVFNGSKIETFVVANGIEHVDTDVFHDCYYLKAIAFSSSLKSFGRSVFYKCTGLTHLEFPKGFTTFNYYSNYETHWQFGFCSGIQESVFYGDVPANFNTSGLHKYGKVWYPEAYKANWSNVVSSDRFGGYSENFSNVTNAVGYSGEYTNSGHAPIVKTRSQDQYTTISYSLSENGPYDSSVIAFTNAGNSSVWCKVDAIGYATVTCKVDFTISPKELTADMVSLSATEFKYSGSEIKPDVSVIDGNEIDAANYEVTYSDNVGVGKAQVVVSGKGNYTGSVSVEFDIVSENVPVKYNTNGGDAMGDVQALSGVAIGELPVPTRTGYTFEGWYSDAGLTELSKVDDTFIIPASGVTLFAKWKAKPQEIMSVTCKQRYPWNGMVDIVVTFIGTSNDVAQTKCTFVATNTATQTALPVTHITGESTAFGSDAVWTRRFVWDASADVGEVKIDDVMIVVAADNSLGGVQLWENGPYWSECNVGATKPEEYGYYFWWGDTIGYTNTGSGWISVKDGTTYAFNTCPTYNKDNATLLTLGYIDETGNLVAVHDAAATYLGGSWRMPTEMEILALINNCDTTWAVYNGISGRMITGRGKYAANSIFIPSAGYGYGSYLSMPGWFSNYWTSTPSPDDSAGALRLGFNSDNFGPGCSGRIDGNLIRPLRKSTIGTVETHLALDTQTGIRLTTNTEKLQYSPTWENGTSVRIKQNGTEVFTGTDEGEFTWSLPGSGTWTLTYETLDANGEVIATETAQFKSDLPKLTYSVDDGGGVYCGDGYKISVNVDDAIDAKIQYSDTGVDDTWVDSLLYTNVCTEKSMYYRITAIGYETETGSAKVTITPKTLTSEMISLSSNEFKYSGSEIKPDVSVIDGDEIDAANYEVTYSDNVGVGKARVIVSGKGNYTESVSVEFDIVSENVPVKYNTNGGDAMGDVQALSGVAIGNLPIPTRTGYTFDGWYSDAELSESSKVDDTFIMPASGVTLFAKWVANEYVVKYDANGGKGTMEDLGFAYDEEKGLDANGFTKEGYSFVGWATTAEGKVEYANGAVVSNLTAEVDGEFTLFAKWAANEYVVKYDANGGKGTMEDQGFVYDVEQSLSANQFTRDGYLFVGWTTNVECEVVYADCDKIENVSTKDDFTLYAVWKAISYKVKFNANGGNGSMAVQEFTYDLGGALNKCTFERIGYTFRGWAKTEDGSLLYDDGDEVTNLSSVNDGVVQLFAVWDEHGYTVSFDANGGEGSMADQNAAYDDEWKLPICTLSRNRYRFVGWATEAGGDVVYGDGGTVANLSADDGSTVTLYAVWEVENMIIGGDSSKPDVMQSAQEYDGCVYDGEKMVGTIVVKAAKGKADRKSGKVTSKLTITIQVAGEKMSLKGDMDVNAGSVEIGTLSLKLGANGMSGTYGAYSIDGARNVFAAKDATSKTTAASVLAKWQGAMAIAYPEVSGGKTNAWVGLSVMIAAKGKAKISGTLADGSKVSVSGQMVVGSEWSCVPVNYAKKGVNLALVLWLKNDGSECEVSGIEGAMVGKANGLDGDCKFQAADLATLVGDDTYAAYFPNGVSVRQDGTKWIVANGAKAGKVALGKDGNVDEAKAGENASALKLTYTARTGAFKGSFKAYKQERGKPKAVSVSVAGVVIDGKGYGSASIKKVGSVAVRIE